MYIKKKTLFQRAGSIVINIFKIQMNFEKNVTLVTHSLNTNPKSVTVYDGPNLSTIVYCTVVNC
jgi:hypothetical protein